MLIVELSVNPLNKGENLNHDVAKTVEIIAQSGLNFEIGPMGTCVEGEFMEVMQVVERCLTELGRDSDELLFTIRGDYKHGREQRLEKRVQEVVGEVFRDTEDPLEIDTVDLDDSDSPARQLQ